MSAYVDGICYQLQAINKNQSLAKTTCDGLGGRLTIIRSTDVAEKMINIFRCKMWSLCQCDQSSSRSICILYRKTYTSIIPNFQYYFWIGAPNDDKYEYNSLNFTNSTDNTYTISVQLNNQSACPVLDWSTTYSNFAFIMDFSPCNFTHSWFFCEYSKSFFKINNTLIGHFAVCVFFSVPTFKQLGCQQALAADSAITLLWWPSTEWVIFECFPSSLEFMSTLFVR